MILVSILVRYIVDLNATYSGIIQNESTTEVYFSTKRDEREQKDTEGTLKHTGYCYMYYQVECTMLYCISLKKERDFSFELFTFAIMGPFQAFFVVFDLLIVKGHTNIYIVDSYCNQTTSSYFHIVKEKDGFINFKVL